MPKHLAGRPPLDAVEERHVRKLAHSAHAPADWIFHAKLIARSWEGLRTRQIASQLTCHPETVRTQLHAFNERGLDGLGMHPGSGRKPRLTPLERSTILALVQMPPAGTPTDELTGELAAPHPQAEPEWALDTLTAAAQQRGIQVARSQGRRIFRREGVRGRRTRLWARSKDPDFVPRVPTRAHIVALSTEPPPEATVLCVDELGPVTPRNFPPAPGWSPDGHRITVPLEYERGLDTVWVDGALCVRDGQVLKRDGARAQHGGVPRAAAHPRPDLSLRRPVPCRRPSGPPPKWTDPGVAGGASPYPAGVHSGRRRVAQPHRRLVADLPPHSLHGRVVGRRRRHRLLRHAHRHGPAQSPRQALGLGTPAATAPLASALFHVSPLRNDAITFAEEASRQWTRRNLLLIVRLRAGYGLRRP